MAAQTSYGTLALSLSAVSADGALVLAAPGLGIALEHPRRTQLDSIGPDPTDS